MRREAWVLIAGLLLSSACAHRRTASVEPQPGDSVTVNILSHVGDMVIYARASGQSFWIGKVQEGKTSQFVLRVGWLWGRSVEFVAVEPNESPEAAALRSGRFELIPGDVIDWEVTTASSRGHRRL